MKTLLIAILILLAPFILKAQQKDESIRSGQSSNTPDKPIPLFGALEDIIEEQTSFSNVMVLSFGREEAETYQLKFQGDNLQTTQKEFSCHVQFSSFTEKGPATMILQDCFVVLQDCTPIRKISSKDGSLGPVECKER